MVYSQLLSLSTDNLMGNFEKVKNQIFKYIIPCKKLIWFSWFKVTFIIHQFLGGVLHLGDVMQQAKVWEVLHFFGLVLDTTSYLSVRSLHMTLL